MRTKLQFTRTEAHNIKELLKQKLHAGSAEREALRQQIRELGFFVSEFNKPGRVFSCQEFEDLVAKGAISIKQDTPSPEAVRAKSGMIPDLNSGSDESYIIDICDHVLGLNAIRQHRFAFLLGDTGARLPVDAYYPELNLVVEYHEHQHTDEVPSFDRRQTASGIHRGIQKRLYDQRRQAVLPEHGIDVVVLSCEEFPCNAQKRLNRKTQEDLSVIRTRLTAWL